MRSVKFWLLGATGFIVSFLFEGFFRKVIAVAMGGVLIVNSGVHPPDWLGEAPAVAAQSIGRIVPDAPNSLPQGIPLELDRATSIMAFKPNSEGHLGITERGLRELEVPVDGTQLRFTEKAIREINKANEDTDGHVGEDFHEKQRHSEYHFDNENLQGGSKRLIDLKLKIIEELQQSSPNGAGARQALGEALHTLQDFYSHSNWVELKKPNIDNRLGRAVISNPVEGFKPCPNSPSKLEGQGLRGLTTGYFVPNTPSGKCRHGNLTIWDGISKDDEKSEYSKKYFLEARELAVWATKDYIRQIVEETPEIAGNAKAIKALLGIEDEKKCDKKNSKNDKSCQLKSGRSGGDPHLVTFDGSQYGFQTVGEFTLVKANDDSFEVQVRQSPFSSSLSVNRAVAVKVGADRVALYAGTSEANASELIRVNGKPTTLQGTKLELPHGGEILKDGSTYVINAPSGEKVLISPAGSSSNPFFNISPFVYNQPGQYSGLLGNMNGNAKDDFQMRGGRNALAVRSTYGDVKQVLNQVGLRVPGALDVTEKLYFDQLYKEFGKSWRITQDTSLFDYPAGKTTQDYVLPGFPERYLTLNMLSATQIEKAQTDCRAAKVAPDLMEACLFDVGFSGMSEFALAAAEVSGYVDIVNQLFPSLNVPKPDQIVDDLIGKVKPNICLPFVGCL
jgi:von Willebrand factor type D domain